MLFFLEFFFSELLPGTPSVILGFIFSTYRLEVFPQFLQSCEIPPQCPTESPSVVLPGIFQDVTFEILEASTGRIRRNRTQHVWKSC